MTDISYPYPPGGFTDKSVVLGGLSLGLGLGAWFQHLYSCCIDHLWVFLVAGAILFPVGILHGVGIFLGLWR